MTVVIVGLFMTKACLQKHSMTKAQKKAGVYTNLAAKDQQPTTPAPPPNGITAPASRLKRATPALAVLNLISGTAAVSIKRFQCRLKILLKRLFIQLPVQWPPGLLWEL